MQLIKYSLRLLIATGSFLGFLGGWALLAHAGKPVQPGTATTSDVTSGITAPLPTVPPLPSQNDPSTNLQPLPSLPSAPSFSTLPRLRTRGS